jgi:hypothetical protein
MINFNKDNDPRKEDNLSRKLQKLLDVIEEMSEEEVKLVNDLENLTVNSKEEKQLEEGIACIIDKIYDALFVENYKEINLSVSKNLNNSLNLIIHNKK